LHVLLGLWNNWTESPVKDSDPLFQRPQRELNRHGKKPTALDRATTN
jgi:hypothetical protein